MYTELLRWYKEQGGYLHPDVTYKVVDGIGGMYAIKDIPKDTIITNKSPEIVASDTNPTFNAVENLAYYLATIKKMEFYLHHLPTYWEYELHNSHFLSPKTILKIKKYHIGFGRKLEQLQQQFNKSVDTILAYDPSVDRTRVMRCLLIVKSRTWNNKKGNRLLRPIVGLFNHHVDAAMPHNCNRCKENTFKINKDIKNGEQIYLSYGKRSIFDLYTTYSFFDPKGFPALAIALYISGKKPEEYKMIKELKDKYGGRLQIQNDILRYTTPKTFLLLTDNPHRNIVNFIMKNKKENKLQVLRSLKEFITKQISKPYTLETIHSLNPDDFTEDEQVIKDILLTYKKIILGNLQWLKTEYDKIKLF